MLSDLPKLYKVDVTNNDNNFTCSLCDDQHSINGHHLFVCQNDELIPILIKYNYC